MSDVAIRKKKNADAQAAFRARRANYIATLEETVTSLESVVLQLQESCRESRNEVLELRQENDRLRLENREREKFWRAHYQTRKSGHSPESDDHPPPLSSPFLGQAQVTHQTGPLIQHPYVNGLGYRNEDYNAAGATNFSNPSSSVPFSANESSSASSSSGDVASALNHRSQKYPAHPYCLQGPPRDPRWSAGLNGDSGTSPHSQSSTYIDSPSLTTTDMSFNGRFSGEEQKTALSSMLDNAPYVFPNGDRFHQNVVSDSIPNSRSLSPTTSTPGSSTSNPLTSSFQFTFSDQSSAGQERAEFDYRRQSLPHCPEVTLHGGTADVSLTGQSADAVRYRIGGRHNDCSVDHRAILPASENGDHGSSDGDHMRRNNVHSHSRSPSPSAAPISCTVAVIKAQAFGALRRTRARTKKTSEGAAKVAMNVLEARGIGIGAPSKRPRLQDDEDREVETP